MFEGFPLHFHAFLVYRLLFYGTELFVHSQSMSEFTHQYTWAVFIYPGIVHTRTWWELCSLSNTRMVGMPKKLHRTTQGSTARSCEKLIGRKN